MAKCDLIEATRARYCPFCHHLLSGPFLTKSLTHPSGRTFFEDAPLPRKVSIDKDEHFFGFAYMECENDRCLTRGGTVEFSTLIYFRIRQERQMKGLKMIRLLKLDEVPCEDLFSEEAKEVLKQSRNTAP